MRSLPQTLIALSSVAAAACGRPITVPVELHSQGEPVTCGTTIDLNGVAIDLVDARFYVSQMVLLDDQNRYNQLRFDRDDAWQDDDVALLDFEDGTGACAGGTAEMHTELTGEHRAPRIVEMSFLLGVPPAMNFQDTAEQDPPVDCQDMHITPNGNLHASVALLRDDAPWTTELFSTDCVFNGAGAACERENIARVSLPYTEGQPLVLDLDVLLIGAGEPGDESGEGCSSDPAQPGCDGLYHALGLDLETGDAVAPATAFSAG